MLRLSRPTTLALVFFSGATGLIYEFCWSKRLANWLGNTGQAHAILLATFMGGLALGAWLFGRRADASKRPLALYGLLELGVGGLALLFPWFLELAGSLYVSVGAAGGNPARLVLAAVTVLPPTLLMGGSLPAMTRALTQSLSTAKGTLASLYALNSLGAAAGSLAAGLLFVPVAGLAVTERFAVLFNVLVGLIALAGGRAEAPAPTTAEPEAPQRVYSDTAVKAVLIGTALSGFTAMLYEVTWIRVLSIIIGGTSYAFTLILSCFILGIALGSFWIARRAEGDALRTFGWLQLGLVVVVCLTIPLYRRLPFVFFSLTQLLRPEHAWSVYLFLCFLFCALLLLPPTVLMGASFPLAGRVVMRSKESVGGEVGRVYLFNTVGTILGSLAGGLVLLPLIGLEGNFTVGLVANLVAAAVCLGAARTADRGPAARTWAPLAAAALLVVVGGVATRGWATFISAAGRYREWHGTFSEFSSFEAQALARAESLFYADDVFASVMVAQQKGTHRFLRINGKADGSNGRGDLDTQMLAAHVGALMHPREVKKVLLVGIGAGITAGSLLSYDLERLDVVEISPAVLDAAKLFSKDNRDALSDPRCHVHIEDARTFLTLSPEKYDLIVSVPSNPWVTGVSGLFSRDFFRVARERLAPGGRMVQWIHTYESNEALVQLVVRTLRDSFEHGTTWLGAADMLLVASREPQTIDLEVMTQRMKAPAVAEDLRRLGITQAWTLLARQVHSDDGQLLFAGEGRINTDDHNLLEYLSPIAYFRSAEAVALYDERIAGGARLAFMQLPPGGEAWGELHAVLEQVHGPADPLVRSAAERWFETEQEPLAPRLALARALFAQGDAVAAGVLLEPVRGEAAAQALADEVSAQLAARGRTAYSPPRRAPLLEGLPSPALIEFFNRARVAPDR